MRKMDTDLLPGQGLILCAVSGGADSVYLLVRLAELGYTVAAAHYNHGLRGAESDRDEGFVRKLCQERGVPLTVEKGDVAALAAREHMGIEEAARRARYDFLYRTADALGAAVIATAHTANDNAETLLLNLARGAGLKGMGGIPPVRDRIVRPMLGVCREQVEQYLQSRGIGYVVDSTNADESYARNRIRHSVVPALESVNPAFIQAAGRAAALARRDEQYLAGLARQFLAEHSDGRWVDAHALAELPWPVASRAVRMMAGRELGEGHVADVLDAARKGGAVDVPGLRIARTGDRLLFGVPARQPLPERTLAVPGVTPLPEAGLTVICTKLTACPQVVHKSYNIFYFQCENICGSISVAGRRPGDSFRPAGRGCTKTLKQLFQQAGVPPWERDSLPVLRDEAGILAVYGVGTAERVSPAAGCGDIIKIEFVRQQPDRGGYRYES